ncbi:MAG: DUF86 domain-containing protein [Methylococcales bacterium]
MDQIVLEKKMDSIFRCLERIKSRLPETKEMFLQDLDAQDVIVLNLTRAVQLSVDLAMHLCANSNEPVPQTMGEAFDTLLRLNILTCAIAVKMKKSVGFRNIAVHNYDEIDLNLAYTIANEHRLDFVEFIRQINSYLQL